ncbi:LysR family transcriptional regulator [Paenibacillus sp. HJGM_3]|uniref:LysR family transcriptional regulator n=1 Tax=Paenibacillus sp. HJGM_3 TaxID=3379816 RepID=UPI003859DAD7
MNLHALKLFHTVAREGSVTRAAEVWRISQPAVTIQLRNLERELDLPLFEPKGRGIALTEAGAMLAEQARRLFALEEEIETNVALHREGKRGKLRIAATSLPAHRLLPQWAAGYKMRYPDVELVLSSCNSQEAGERLLGYEADLAFIGSGEAWPEQIDRELLLEDEMVFVVPSGHSLANKEADLETMMREFFLVREAGSSARDRLERLCRERGLRLRIGLTFNGISEMIRAVAAGYGAMFVSRLEVQSALSDGEVATVRVRGVSLTNPIHMCRRKGETLTPTARHFAAWVREQLAR